MVTALAATARAWTRTGRHRMDPARDSAYYPLGQPLLRPGRERRTVTNETCVEGLNHSYRRFRAADNWDYQAGGCAQIIHSGVVHRLGIDGL